MIVTDVGSGMRWTWWRHRRMAPPRTAKSCGPDASTPASSLAVKRGATVTRKSDRRGARNRPLKPLRRECRVVWLNLW